MTFVFYVALVLFLLLCLLLCMLILAQESKSSGFGASFGGDVGGSVFGTATADVIKRFTAWMAVIFFASCILLSFWTSSMGRTQAAPETVIEAPF